MNERFASVRAVLEVCTIPVALNVYFGGNPYQRKDQTIILQLGCRPTL